MNTSLQKLIAGVVSLPRNLPGVLAAWDTYDDDLREEYAEQVPWLIRSAREALLDEMTRTAAPHERLFALQQSVATAVVQLMTMGDLIEEKMGFRPEQLLPGVTVAGFVDPRPKECAVTPSSGLFMAA